MKVLIIDDERLICLGLKKLLEHIDHSAIDRIRTTTYPHEAISIADEFDPDIVLTDIRMPGINGLELIDKLMKRHPDIKFTVLSGYNDFSYVQKALRLGAVDYLLKPATKEELISVIDRMVNLIEMERLRHGDSPGTASTNDTAVMEAAFSSIVFDKDLSSESTDHIRSLIQERMAYPQMAIALVDCRNQENQNKLLTQLTDWRNKWSSNDISWYHFTFRTNIVLVHINARAHSDTMMLAAAIRHLFALSSDSKSQEIIVGVSATVDKTCSVATLFYQAQLALDRKISGATGVIEYEKLASSDNRFAIDEQQRQELTAACRGGQFEQILGAVSAALDEECLYLREWYEHIITALTEEQTGTDVHNCDVQRVYDSFYDIHDLKDHVTDIVKCIYGQSTVGDHDGWLIRKVKNYVLENYGTGTSLKEIADELHISYAYLSTLFKSSTGETYTSYLTRIRMQRAAELIENTGFSITEIAGKLGYASAKHFSRTFHRYYGVSPKQFQAGRSI